MLQKLKNISTKEKFANKWWRYIVDEYTWPDGSIGEYHFVRTSGSTMIIPRLNETSFVMTRQYRYLNSKVSLEFPGGGIKQGLTPEQNAIEELQEEAGYVSGKLEMIGFFNPFNGVTDEICTVFLADELESTHASPEASEEFEIVILTKKEIINKIKSGELWDGMSLAAWSIFQNSK
jgi:ADP-ribose pyrophosphatase